MVANFQGGSGLVDAGWFSHDLLGAPVAANRGAKGRPQHVATKENFRIAMGLYSLNKSDQDVADALGITVPTLKRHYFSNPHLKALRRAAQNVIKGLLVGQLLAEAEAGSVPAIKQMLQLIDKANFVPVPAAEKKEKLGKKEQKLRDAHLATTDQDWGDLMRGPARVN